MKRQKELVIQTPEGIVFPLLIADPVSRFAALLIDKLCIYALSGIVSFVLRFLGFIGSDLIGALLIFASFVISLGYGIAFEWYWRGQTVGKRALKLQVMDEQGLRLQFSQIVIRNLLRFVDMLPCFYMVGGLSCLISARGQRLGDIAANTIVIQNPRILEPDLEQVLSDKYNSFREHPHLAARLRQNVSPKEAGVVYNALIRRDLLNDDARVALFAQLRAHVEEKVKFPEDVTDGISDEQYIRNTVDILFR